jgi:acyl-CoA synthetase (AMP-forming)/AMP-acid ligase II
MIDPAMGKANMVESLESTKAEGFIGIPMAHVLRVLKRSSFKNVKVAVTVGPRIFWGGYSLKKLKKGQSTKFKPAKTKPDTMAAMFFTSGSTGPPKGVVYEHGMLMGQMQYIEHLGYGPSEVDLSTFPLFALYDTAMGMTSVTPDMDTTAPGKADPAKLISAIKKYKCSHMFGSPALLTNLANYCERAGERMPTMKMILTAGAPIHPLLLRKLQKMIHKDGEILTPYGATEALPITRVSSREILSETWERTEKGGGTCVGNPFKGNTVRIIELTERPIPTWDKAKELPVGEIGEITVKGPVVTKEYFKKPRANAEAKIKDGKDTVHRMGDTGYLDEKGRLWFCGRKAHRVQTKKGTLFTVPCEAVFNTHPKVFRSALVGVGKPGDKIPVIVIELKKGEVKSEGLTKELLKRAKGFDITKDLKKLLYHDSFPVDIRHNAKINRERLAEWAEGRV